MDNNVNLLSSTVQEMKKSAKKTNTNNKASHKKAKPVKVVYISNPMKIKTSASQFRALVQELTGRDSELPHDPAKFSAGGDRTVKIGGDLHHDDDDDDDNNNDHDLEEVVVMSSTNNSESSTNYTASTNSTSATNPYDAFEDDDVFMPQIMEGFSGILPSTSVWYESPHINLCD